MAFRSGRISYAAICATFIGLVGCLFLAELALADTTTLKKWYVAVRERWAELIRFTVMRMAVRVVEGSKTHPSYSLTTGLLASFSPSASCAVILFPAVQRSKKFGSLQAHRRRREQARACGRSRYSNHPVR